MIAPRLLPRDEWEHILKEEEECSPCAEGDVRRLQTAEWWRTKHNRIFTVPVDEEGRISAFDLQMVRVEISQLRPLDWDR